MTDIVELHHVSKHYRRGSETIRAVGDVNFTVRLGDFLAIVGPSGSGKTTLLNLVGCMDTPDGGTLRIDGEETSGLKGTALARIRARKIGFVFQQFFLLPTLTAQENVQLPALFVHRGDRANHARELLDRVGLGARADHLPSQLSGGEMQRVAIARALINEPMILLADEPTGNLDSHNAEAILSIFRDLNASGLTILMVTHNTELASEANSVVQFRDGEMVAESSARTGSVA